MIFRLLAKVSKKIITLPLKITFESCLTNEEFMQQWPTTRNTLLVQLAGEQYEKPWFEFAHIYEPVIYRFARRRGLQHTDANELTQQVMLRVMKSAKSWREDAPPDRFRSWLKTVADRSLINLVTRNAKYRANGGDDTAAVAELSTEDIDRQLWAQEEERATLRAAASLIRREFSTSSWAAFELTLLQGYSVESVSKRLDKSAGAVYAARARIVRRLKQEVARLRVDQASESSGVN